jgi:translocation protein SEC63
MVYPTQMNVEAPVEGGPVDEEDDISEPDEDSLAGQMAMMKGQPVRRIGAGESDDDTSGTEEEDDDDDSSSDSDSD